jgi:glycosyltransferase involved in cell wall biosynthesis
MNSVHFESACMGTTKVLLIHNIPSPHVMPYFSGLAKFGFDVTVAFCAQTLSTRRWDTSVNGEFKWEILPGFRWEVQMEERIGLQLNPSIVWRICRGKYDAVVLFAGYDSPTLWLAACVSRILKIPLVLRCGSVPGITAYGGNVDRLARWRRTLSGGLKRWIVRSAASYVSYGSRSKRYLAELGAPEECVYPLWNTIDVESLLQQSVALKAERTAIRQELGFAIDEVVVLYVGRLQPVKYVGRLIAAYGKICRTNPNASLSIVGYGPTEQLLRTAAAGIPRIKWHGAKEQKDVARFYTAADIFVLPSADIWGLVVNEAMAFGLPVVAADTVGCTDDLVLASVTGLVYPCTDVAALSDAIERLVVDPDLRVRMGEAGRSHIRNFTYDKALPSLVRALHTALRTGRKVNASPESRANEISVGGYNR